ncbi:MAG: hypothetical protein LBR06_05405 [Bacteroidales bacterium]|jgi:hypothetical protein|nr:hypothetical protein [Bacteroidales bacterium]
MKQYPETKFAATVRRGISAGLTVAMMIVLTASDVVNSEEAPVYAPVYMTRAELEQSVKYIAPTPLHTTGKIYFYNPYIFINEQYKGVHVINNSEPKNPVNEGFITAPGCMDMAVKDGILYLDNAVDIVAFNLSTRQVTERIKEVLPAPTPPEGYYSYRNDSELAPDLVLVGWRQTN